jgi:hypothetical protein
MEAPTSTMADRVGRDGREAPRYVDIGKSGGWESWTSSVEHDDAEDSYMRDNDEEYVEENPTIPDLSSGSPGMPIVDHNCGVDGGGGKDLKAAKGIGKVVMRKQAVLRKVRAQFQFHPDRAFDKEDIKWVKNMNSNGRGKKEVLHAIIPWNRLEDFVEGESTSRGFPCAFLWKKQREVQLGALSRIKISSYKQKFGKSTCRTCSAAFIFVRFCAFFAAPS